eukprot:COSAG03_NODE_6011_length_1131_cov_1.413760_1_plen_46_part_10
MCVCRSLLHTRWPEQAVALLAVPGGAAPPLWGATPFFGAVGSWEAS